MNLTKNVSIGEVGIPNVLSGSLDINSDRIDMTGFDGITLVCPILSSTSSSVISLTVEQSNTDSDTSMAALDNSVATVTASANGSENDTLLIVDVGKPVKRYVQAVRTTTVNSAGFGTVIAMRYKGKKLPVVQDSSVAALAVSVSPDES